MEDPAQRIVDTRAVGKPPVFEGADKDWSDWSFIFRSYTALLSRELENLMTQAEQATATIPVAIDDDDRQLSRDLFHLLVMLTRGKALTEIRKAPAGNGLEAWRLIVVRYERHERGRALGLLHRVLNPTFEDIKQPSDIVD